MAAPPFAPVVGLIGGVGSGKSSVAKSLAERRTVVVIDGDAAGHQVLEHPEVKTRIRQRFGGTVFDVRGEVNRAALGRTVFGSSAEHHQARADLEEIVHPLIRKSFVRQIAAARSSDDVEAVILDAAVLLEAGWNDLCDCFVFVEVPAAERLRRVVAGRGWNEDELNRREANQLPLDAKRSQAAHTIDNSGSVDSAADQLDEIVEEIINQTR